MIDQFDNGYLFNIHVNYGNEILWLPDGEQYRSEPGMYGPPYPINITTVSEIHDWQIIGVKLAAAFRRDRERTDET